MQDAIIYLGPSLPHDEARKILDADYRLPVKRGDLALAVQAEPKVIGIIDGFFFQDTAVGHREILAVLKRGIRVIGSSSMGALRASELDAFGMEGVGEVYRLYHEGIVESDDEVALTCDPESGEALSEALVNIRITCNRAAEEGILSARERDEIILEMKHLFYPERSWEMLKTIAGRVIQNGQAFQDWLTEHAIDQKRRDAIEALIYIREILPEIRKEPAIRF